MELQFVFGNPVKGKKSKTLVHGKKSDKLQAAKEKNTMTAKKRKKVKIASHKKSKTHRKNPVQYKVKHTTKNKITGKKITGFDEFGLPMPSKQEIDYIKGFIASTRKTGMPGANKKDLQQALRMIKALTTSGGLKYPPATIQKIEDSLKSGTLWKDQYSKAELQGITNLLKKYLSDYQKTGKNFEAKILNLVKSGQKLSKEEYPIRDMETGISPQLIDRLSEVYGKGTNMAKKHSKKKSNPVFAVNPSLGEDGEQNPRKKKRKKLAKKVCKKTSRKKSHKKSSIAAFIKNASKSKHKKHRKHAKYRRHNPGIADLPSILGPNSTWMSLAMLGVAAGTAGTLNALANKYFLDGLLSKLPASIQKPLAAVRPALIPAALGAGLYYLGRKNKMAKQLGEAYATTAIVALGINIVAPFMKKVLPMAGIPEGMGDVALLGIPEGMSGVELLGIPEGMGDDEYGDADFGDADFGDADFGDADFGDADFGDADFGGIPEGMSGVMMAGDEDIGEDLEGSHGIG